MENKSCSNCKYYKKKYCGNPNAQKAGECLINTFRVINSDTGNPVFRKLSIYHYHLCDKWEENTGEEIKSCTYCGEVKPVDQFSILKHKHCNHGYSAVCKECQAIAVKERAERNPERHKEIQKAAQKKYADKKRAAA
jgi:hypothetical protein